MHCRFIKNVSDSGDNLRGRDDFLFIFGVSKQKTDLPNKTALYANTQS